MISAVLDTNVLVSGIIGQRRSTTPAALIAVWRRGDFELVVSQDILDEVERTFRKPYFAARITDDQVRRLLITLRRRSRVVSLTATLKSVATHPEDDLILSTAVSASAHYLVTGDRQLQVLATISEVQIVSPARFVAILETEVKPRL
ncbi:MAG: putative toxin-antitoxin system toxin component, PIN family [Chloroflexota bacterium]|nr:putative toxin-antitoxin system toxin component, PIN family [Chloroflexota bacterium]